jgi:hypothetical protein
MRSLLLTTIRPFSTTAATPLPPVAAATDQPRVADKNQHRPGYHTLLLVVSGIKRA